MTSSSDEDSILSKLKIYEPDGIGTESLSTPFVKVSLLKEFRLTVDSDTDMKIQLEWSMDGKKIDYFSEFDVMGNICFSREFEVMLQYLRISVNSRGKISDNHRLKLIAFSHEDKFLSKEMREGKEGSKKKAEKFFRSLSPSQKLRRRNSKDQSSKELHLNGKESGRESGRDSGRESGGTLSDRFPETFSKGSLFYAKNEREIGMIEPGKENHVLMFLSGSPMWVSLEQMFGIYDDIRREYFAKEYLSYDPGQHPAFGFSSSQKSMGPPSNSPPKPPVSPEYRESLRYSYIPPDQQQNINPPQTGHTEPLDDALKSVMSISLEKGTSFYSKSTVIKNEDGTISFPGISTAEYSSYS